MEKGKHNSSAFSVSNTLQDTTLLSTPLPKAASTAIKRSSMYTGESGPSTEYHEDSDRDFTRTSNPDHRSTQPDFGISQIRNSNLQARTYDSTVQKMNELQERISREMDKLGARRLSTLKRLSASSSSKQPNSLFSEFIAQNPEKNHRASTGTCSSFFASKGSDGKNHDPVINKDELNQDLERSFEFAVPSIPSKAPKSNLGVNKMLRKDPTVISTNLSNFNEISSNFESYKPTDASRSKTDYMFDLPERLSDVSKGSTKPDYENKRYSAASSANSSLGILPFDAFEEAANDPFSEISLQVQLDLSHRLAEQLSLDTSNIKGMGLDISQLASASLKQALTSRGLEDKENSRGSSLSAGGGYSSDSSTDHSHNNTAREFTRLSADYGVTDLPEKDRPSFTKKSPLSERNSSSGRDTFTSNLKERLSTASDRWSDMSRVSVGSDMFEPGEDVEARLRKDEAAWRGQLERDSIRSLSGIYGDGDISIRTHGEKLSISSFLRSGSGPLGGLEKSSADLQRPTFGRPVVSPQKKSKARPILPPPKDKLTFCLDNMSTKDTNETERNPWNVQSLVEQFSVVHGEVEGDVSVPSLSFIGQLLEEMKDAETPRDIMDRLMSQGASKMKSSNTSINQSKIKTNSVINLDSSMLSQCGKEKLKTISAVVEGEKSFCRGYESDRSTRYSSSFDSHLSLDEDSPALAVNDRTAPIVETINLDDTNDPSLCNVTDFDREEEDYVCVLTPESMDFDIFNDFNREQQYIISKACYLFGRRQDNAAMVYLPVTHVTLQPGEKQLISVTVAALIPGTIKIKIEVTKLDPLTQERESSNIFGKIIAEVPKISLLNPESMDMRPVEDERLKYQEVMVLQNNGRSVVPIKLTLTQTNYLEANMFFLDQEQVTYRLEPGRTLRQVVNCVTPPIFESSKTAGKLPVTAQVQVTLATSVKVKLPPLTTTNLTARIPPNFFCVPGSLTVPVDSPLLCQVYNSGLRPYSLQASATVGFTVQPAVFTVQPHQTVTLTITFLERSLRKGSLTLKASELYSNSTAKVYTTYLQGTSSCSASLSATPHNSRPSSPTSPCSTISEGGLLLACTHKELVWGSCALQQRVVKSCSLKNQNCYREKLRLSVTGPHNCFKILTEKKVVENEMLVSMQPMETCQISVVMLAASPGPKWGHLTISRLSNPQDKKVLLLYAFGGRAHINIEGVMTDPEHHMWVYLDPDTLCSTFVLTNTGDYAAFFKICEGMSATTVGGGLSVSPPEQILEPGHAVSVDINLSVTPDRLEYLLAQSSQKAICITRLTVTSGDESTRQRLGRLSRVQPKLAEKLSQLNQLPATPIPDLDRLKDPSACAENLWLEDISEWTIGVLVERSALQALRLDTSVKFVDLGTTVLHG